MSDGTTLTVALIRKALENIAASESARFEAVRDPFYLAFITGVACPLPRYLRVGK